MNTRDREFPDRRGAGEVAPRSSRSVPILVELVARCVIRNGPRCKTVTASSPSADADGDLAGIRPSVPVIAIGPVIVLDQRRLAVAAPLDSV